MFDLIKNLVIGYGIGFAAGAAAVGLIWGIRNYFSKKSTEDKKVEEDYIGNLVLGRNERLAPNLICICEYLSRYRNLKNCNIKK